jgi:hypothetical protein
MTRALEIARARAIDRDFRKGQKQHSDHALLLAELRD